MELQLALALPLPTNYLHLNSNNLPFHKKRTFHHAQETTHTNPILPTLSLLPLTPSHHTHQSSNIPKNDDEALVGWPPLNYSRKKPRFHHSGDEVADNDHMVWVHRRRHHHHHHHHAFRGSNTLYVKVKMEGVGIARKVINCQTPTNWLIRTKKVTGFLQKMYHGGKSFVRSARRLKLLKSSG
ncbi:hypothetical protein VNO77_24263 [Canavalia gladiata]|uniref:Auxin-induced protein n=1 Tax=Canavalia gladiata TaxID=3824 RepID=A0AAN9QG28_CANGL